MEREQNVSQESEGGTTLTRRCRISVQGMTADSVFELSYSLTPIMLTNLLRSFTGWADPDLSERGRREVEHAARLLLEGGYEIDVCFTSRLKRAIRSTWIILEEMNQSYLPCFKSWRLNERM